LWFWFVILSAITFIDLVVFVINNCWPSQRYFYVKKHVLIFNKLNKQQETRALNEFTNKYLKPDIVLVFKLLATNVNGVIVSELIKQLWDQYYHKKTLEGSFDDDDDDDDDVNEKLDRLNEDDQDKNIPSFPNNANQGVKNRSVTNV
jgi:hypothetical protein